MFIEFITAHRLWGIPLRQLEFFILGNNPESDGKKTSPTDLLILVFETRLAFLFGWRLELMLDPLMQGRVKRVHAEKFPRHADDRRAVGFGNRHRSPIHNRSPVMNSDDLKAIENQRQALLGQLTAAEAALRAGLHTHGFGSTARAHMERAMAHIQEAYIAINEMQSRPHRTATRGRPESDPAGDGPAPHAANPNTYDLCLNAPPTAFS